MYYKTRVKQQLKNFKWKDEELQISDEIIRMYKSIKGFFTKAIDQILQGESTNIEEETDLKVIKKTERRCIATKKHRSSEHVYDRLSDILRFYDASNVMMTKIFEQIFQRPVSTKKSAFVYLNKLFKMFMIFDITRYKHNEVFHEMSMCKKERKDQCNEFFIRKCKYFSAISMPMAHLFLSFFCKNEKEIHLPPELIKRSPLNLNSKRREHLYLLASLTCENMDLIYCGIFFSGLFNNFFYSKSILEKMEKLDNMKKAYLKALIDFK